MSNVEGKTALDGSHADANVSDLDNNLLVEEVLVDEEDAGVTEAADYSENAVEESKTNFISSEMETELSNETISSEGVMYDAYFQELGRTESNAYEVIVEEDCLDKIRITEDGPRLEGPKGCLSTERKKCSKKKSPFNQQEDTFTDWIPNLTSVDVKSISTQRTKIPISETKIRKSNFDRLIDGTDIDMFTIFNDRVEVDVITLGARVTAVRIKQRDRWVDVALGLANASDYQSSKCDKMGGTIGKYCVVPIETACVEPNQPNQYSRQNYVNCAFERKIWEAKRRGDALVMTCRDNTPGNDYSKIISVAFSLTGDCALNIEYFAEVESLQLTNAIYFNLAGHDAGAKSVYDHSIFVNSQTYCDPTDATLKSVFGSPFDTTNPKHIGCLLRNVDNDDLNVAYLLERKRYELSNSCETAVNPPIRVAAVAQHYDSGVTLIVSTNQRGLRVFTSNKITQMRGKGSETIYNKKSGFCIQPASLSYMCDSVKTTDICSVEPYHHTVRYRFLVDNGKAGQAGICINELEKLISGFCLSCDACPNEEKNEDEAEIPYKKVYSTLTKYAHEVEDIGEEDYSLSVHSSFTSFGSSEQEAEVRAENPETSPDEGANMYTQSQQSAATPEILVKEPVPLPPYLTGKWPVNPRVEQQPGPTPARRICLPPTITTTIPQTQHPLENPDGKTAQGFVPLREAKTKEYTPIKVGTVNRIDEEKIKIALEAGGDISESDNVGANKQIFTSVPGEVSQANDVPQQAGHLFKLINYPDEYIQYKGTEDDLLNELQLKHIYLKSLYQMEGKEEYQSHHFFNDSK